MSQNNMDARNVVYKIAVGALLLVGGYYTLYGLTLPSANDDFGGIGYIYAAAYTVMGVLTIIAGGVLMRNKKRRKFYALTAAALFAFIVVLGHKVAYPTYSLGFVGYEFLFLGTTLLIGALYYKITI